MDLRSSSAVLHSWVQRLAGPGVGGAVVQRVVTDPLRRADLLREHIARLAAIQRQRDLLAAPPCDIAVAAAFTPLLTEVTKWLNEAYALSIDFEHTVLYGGKEWVGGEKQVTDKVYFINWWIEDTTAKIDESWLCARRAHAIRQRLRIGAAAYRADPSARIPELYAGDRTDATEIIANTSFFARLINDDNWFTDAGGAPFVRHERSRSAMLGYSPQGEPGIPLHIGHRND